MHKPGADDVIICIRAGAGPVRESEGALCVFLDDFKTREGEPLPLIVRKSDGGFNYATSDLATIIHRVEQLKATRIIYVVGQVLHKGRHVQPPFQDIRKQPGPFGVMQGAFF